MTTNTQPCPLCDLDATFSSVSEPREGKRFECPSCTHFFIDTSSGQYLTEMQEVTRTEVRTALQQKARQSGPDRLLVIRAPLPNERGGDGRGVARMSLMAEWVDRPE